MQDIKRAFFPKSESFFLFSKKSRGELSLASPRLHLSTQRLRQVSITQPGLCEEDLIRLCLLIFDFDIPNCFISKLIIADLAPHILIGSPILFRGWITLKIVSHGVTLCEECQNTGFFLVLIFLFLNWMQRFTL